MIKNILFDLDGTLLPMDQDQFMKYYFKEVQSFIGSLGYDVEEFMKHFNIATYKMLKNDGSKTNEKAFWDYINAIYTDNNLEVMFEKFYKDNFVKLQKYTSKNPLCREIIDYLKEKGYNLVLATNPLFPSMATYERMSWNDLYPSDFSLVTTYDNSSYAKPKEKYYLEIIEHLGLDIKESLMVGNDMDDDFSEIDSKIATYLVTDCLINKGNKQLIKNNGTMSDLFTYLKGLD